jgi:PTS system nitrogen regulatory IIA component
MLISEIIAERSVMLGDPCDCFEDAVRCLVDTLVADGRLAAALHETAVHAICEREQMSSTVIAEIGISVPHARLPGIDGVIGALAVSPRAIFYAMAEVPISIVALVLSAPDRAAEHLNALASLSVLLHSEDVRTALRQASDSAAVHAVLLTERRAFA